jgi:F420 biosynthesis protein FbiB-like protein
MPPDADPVLNALLARRSIRRYRDQPVPRTAITAVLDAARWGPSAHNRQPWRFCVLETAEARAGLAAAMGERLRRDLEADGVPEAVIAADTGRSYARITGAPVAIVLSMTMADMDTYPDARRNAHERWMAGQSVAMAGQNLLVAAHRLGLGACWMCAPLFAPDVVRHALVLPSDWEPQALITLGYPAETKEKPRRPLGDLTVWR